MSDHYTAVRSYQRIFRPDRRIYQIDGRRLPVPGGIALSWLGYAIATLLLVVVLSRRSPGLALLIGATGSTAALRWRAGARTAAAAGLFGAAVVIVAGWLLATLDWPLRLLVCPGLAATLATQVTPDGRPAHRFLWSWLSLQLRPERRSLGRPLSASDEPHCLRARVRVTSDEHDSRLRRARVHGPATVAFAAPVLVRQGRWRAGVWRTRPATAAPSRRHEQGPISRLRLSERVRLVVGR